jgi:hypothetical protein
MEFYGRHEYGSGEEAARELFQDAMIIMVRILRHMYRIHIFSSLRFHLQTWVSWSSIYWSILRWPKKYDRHCDSFCMAK